jgi:hypothetical protein
VAGDRGVVTYASAFSYRHSIAPTMWMLIALSGLEALAVHFLIYFWSPVVALILTLLTLGGITWMVALLRSFKRLPVLVGGEGVTMRVGTLRCVHVPVAQISGLRLSFAGSDVKQPGLLNLALIAYPNVLLDLDPPLPGKRAPTRTIAHRIDDPIAFQAAVQALLAGAVTR